MLTDTHAVNPQSTLGFTPLSGFRVLDLSQGVAGPYCAQLLGQQGAEVIKVEPLEGDWGRHVGRTEAGHSTLSTIYNGGKRSVAIDAKHPSGQALILALARRSDLLIQNFRPAVMQRLGLSFEQLAAQGIEPVYVSISGYGADGPYADFPATDTVMQADSGLMHTNRDAREQPHRVGLLLADIATGLYAAQTGTAALLHKLRTGRATHVQVNLFSVCCALQAMPLADDIATGGAFKPAVSAPNGLFEAADGRLNILALNNDQFLRLARALDCPHWIEDPRYATNALRVQHKDELHAELAARVRPRRLDELEAVFRAHSVLHARVRNAAEVLAHPQAQHLGNFHAVQQPHLGELLVAAAPWVGHPTPEAAPRIGEHTAAVLGELGVDAAKLQALAEARVIGL